MARDSSLERAYVLVLLLLVLASVWRQHRTSLLVATVGLCQHAARSIGQLAIAAEDEIRKGVTV